MKRMRVPILVGAALMLVACATAPGEVVRDGDTVRGTGTVNFVTLEGGFYAIKGDDDRVYTPMELPEAFREDGLRVRFTARLRPDVYGFAMMGETVELRSIERL